MQTVAGQAVYTPLTLWLYDWYVLGLSNHLIWKCPTAWLRALYRRNVAARHLDIGVGTGYYLDKTTWPVDRPDITLLDMNANSLAKAAQRIDRYAPRTKIGDVLRPLPPWREPFGSIGLCYLLHCLPGSTAEKAVVFDHVMPAMADGAVVFGATIVQGDLPRSWLAQKMMNLYNRKGIFSNTGDTEQDLRAALEARFSEVSLDRRGVVVSFEARGPRAGREHREIDALGLVPRAHSSATRSSDTDPPRTCCPFRSD